MLLTDILIVLIVAIVVLSLAVIGLVIYIVLSKRNAATKPGNLIAMILLIRSMTSLSLISCVKKLHCTLLTNIAKLLFKLISLK